jgi:hypothetical protein
VNQGGHFYRFRPGPEKEEYFHNSLKEKTFSPQNPSTQKVSYYFLIEKENGVNWGELEVGGEKSAVGIIKKG